MTFISITKRTSLTVQRVCSLNKWIPPRRAGQQLAIDNRKAARAPTPTVSALTAPPSPEAAPPPPPNSTAALLHRNLHPVVSAEETAEYKHYLTQFEPLNLAYHVSEKDRAVYEVAATIAQGPDQWVSPNGAELLVVSQASQTMYSEAIKVARAGQELKASLDRGE